MKELHDYQRSPYGLGWEHARRNRRGNEPFPYNSRRWHDYRQGKADYRSGVYLQAGIALGKALCDTDQKLPVVKEEQHDPHP